MRTARSLVLLAPVWLIPACAAWPAPSEECWGCEASTSTGTTAEPGTATAIQTVTGDPDSGPASDTGGVDNTSLTASASASGGPAEILPEILDIELPAEVNAAGPVPITVLAKNTSTVHVRLDGVDIGELAGAGKDVFVGEFAVKGAVDNGIRHVEVIAALDEHEDREDVDFEVHAPPAGKLAWSKPGPLGSRANGLALTAAGDVLEGGLRIGAELPRPSVLMRSGFDGHDLWPKKVLVSELEGQVADVAIAPDGGIWVAMNVREASQKWRPHVVRLTPDGSPTGVDEPGIVGQTLRAIAADEEGGGFAVGFAAVEGGDFDIVYQGVSAAGQGTVTDHWDYQPGVMAHVFADAAMDVVIDGDVAWIAGLSSGKHEAFDTHARGLLVSIDLHTGEVVGPVIVAPAALPWNQSMFFGVTVDLEGLVVTGAGCEKACGGMQRVETSRYTPEGVRTWHQTEAPADGAYGSAVAVDSQGRAIVAGASKEGGVFRGLTFARRIDKFGPDQEWVHLFPYSKDPSEALAVTVDKYDRVFVDGYITTGGSSQTWLVQLSP